MASVGVATPGRKGTRLALSAGSNAVGSPGETAKRAPACVNLATYPVRREGDSILVLIE